MRPMLVLAMFTLSANADSVTPPRAEAVARRTTARWKIDGAVYKLTQRPLEVGEGVVGRFLGSCTDGPDKMSESPHTLVDFHLAQAGEHFRIAFDRPRSIHVMNERIQVDEIIIAERVIWVRGGTRVGRFAKYDPRAFERFHNWLRWAEKHP